MPVVSQATFNQGALIGFTATKLKDLRKHELIASLTSIGNARGYKKYNFQVGDSKIFIDYEMGNLPMRGVKLEAIEDSVRLIHSKKFKLPPTLRFFVLASSNVPSQAFPRCPRPTETLKDDPAIVISSKADTYEEGKNNNANLIKGGMGKKGPRGVHDQIYDLADNKRAAEKNRMIALVVHEIGHILHFFYDTKRFGILKTSFGISVSGLIAAKVSDYVQKQQNCLELVAEVFTGKIHGLSYSKDVMDCYYLCGGPKPIVPPRRHSI